MAIFIKEQPIDLTIIKKDSYPDIRNALGRTGIKVRHRSIQSDNYVPGTTGWIIRANGTIEAITIIAGNYITSFVQSSIPTSLHIGDLWIKTDDNNKVYRAESVGANEITSGEWVEYGTLANWGEIVDKPSSLFQIFYQATAPDSGMNTGDYWIDSDDNKVYRYDGSWSEVQDDDIATAISDAATAQSTADGKIYVYKQDAEPNSGMGAGDLWFDTNDKNKAYRYSGSTWEAIRDTDIAQAISDAATAQSTADGKITTFIQASAPTAEGTGDLWLDSDDGYRTYRWSGSGWIDIQDTDIGQALSDAATAQSAADTAQSEADRKIVSFYQISAPTAEQTGDLWFDTDDDNKPYRWSGSAWAAAEFDVAAWSKIVDDDSNKPEDGATEGATAGADLKESGGGVASQLAGLFTDLGSIIAGDITLDSSGFIKGGQTAFDAGDEGFWMGYSTTWKFSMAASATQRITLDASGLIIKATLHHVAGDVETIMNDWTTEGDGTITSANYVKRAEISIKRGGTLRIKFVLNRGSACPLVYGKLYRNGSPVGTERTRSATGKETFSEDLSGWSPDDLVQLYTKCPSIGGGDNSHWEDLSINVGDFDEFVITMP